MKLLPFAALTAAVVFVARREWRRVNAELDRTRGRATPPAGILKRDAVTGEWRPSTRP